MGADAGAWVSAAPVTDGALRLIDVSGDDRLSFAWNTVTWSSDGRALIAIDATGVHRWSAETGALLQSIPLPAPTRFRLVPVPSPDDRWIAVGGQTGEDEWTAWLLSTTGAPARSLGRFTDPFSGNDFGVPQPQIRFSRDGGRLFTRTHVWDLTTGAPPRIFPADRTVAPDGLHAIRFATDGGQRYAPTLVDRATGRAVHAFPPVHFPESVAFNRAGTLLALGGIDGLRVYAADTYALRHTVPAATRGSLAQVTDDGRLALVHTFGTDAGTAIWDVATGARLRLITEGGLRHLSNDGRWLYGSYFSGAHSVMRVADGTETRFGIHTLSLSPDGTRALIDTATGLALVALDGGAEVPQLARRPRVLARSPDGQRTVGLGADGAARLEGPGTCVDLGPLGTQRTFAFSADGTTVFEDAAPIARAIAADTGVERWALTAPNATVAILEGTNAIALQAWGHPARRFGTDGAEVLPRWTMPALVWMDRGAQVHAFTARDPDGPLQQGLQGIAVSADGGTLAAASMIDQAAHLSIWSAGSPRDVVDVRLGGGLLHGEFHASVRASPDGERWAVTTTDRTLVIVDRVGDTVVVPHDGLVRSFAFTPSGDLLVTAAGSRVRVLDARTGEELGHARFARDAPRWVWISGAGREAWVETDARMRVRLALER